MADKAIPSIQGNAYLAQSPQLYKQMALMTDMSGNSGASN